MLNKKGFTLVELIVVITILSILGTIAFISLQGYSRDARDSTRIANIKQIELGSELFIIKTGIAPYPDNPIEFYLSGGLFLTQGETGINLLNNVNVSSNGGVDPKSGKNFIYSRNKTEYSILAYLENGGLAGIINNTYASSYSGKTIYSRGKDSGIILNSDKSPLISGFDINSLSINDKYIIAYNESTFQATKVELKLLSTLNNKDLAKYDSSIAGYWPIDYISNNKFKDYSKYKNNCDIGIKKVTLEKGFKGNAANLKEANSNTTIDCGNSLELNSPNFTISIFLKRLGYNKGYYENPQNNSSRIPEFISRGGGHGAFSLRSNEWSNFLGLEYGVPADLITGNTWASTKRNNIDKDKWTNFTYTYNNNINVLNLYQNGLLIETKQIIIRSLNNNYFYLLGTQEFNGLIDEAKIYNRVLNDEEIKFIYNKYF